MATSPSLVTVTLNPALDVSTSVPAMVPDRKLRCEAPAQEAGGGGINVARVAHRMGAAAIAVAPIGGTAGAMLGRELKSEGVPHVLVPIQAETRMSFTVSESSSGSQYRFVLPGPVLSTSELQQIASAAVAASDAPTCVVVSGSLPPGAPSGTVADLAEAFERTNGESPTVVIDTSADALEAAAGCAGSVIKPSVRELEQLVGRALDDEYHVVRAATEIVESNPCRALVVSIGPGGAFVVQEGSEPVRLRAPTVKVRSTVGAGDSLVAGMAVGLSRGLSLVEAARLGIAAGTATVLTDGSQLCDPVEVNRLLPLVG